MDDRLDAISKNLEIIKRLMIFQLLERGISQSRLGEALGVNQSTISRMIPKGAAKKAGLKSDE
jgi:IS30 family transposase